MLKKNFMGRVVFAVVFVSLTMLLSNLTYAQKEPKGSALPETQAYNPPVCPTCKSKVATRTKGKVTAPIVMHCPDCKKERTEAGVAHCDKCEKDFLICVECLKVSKPVATRCPKCKKVLARRIKGKIESPVKWKMKCPDCKKKPGEWLIHHCDECDADFLACPLCEKK
ncbi:MAG: hypothetical protein K8F52_08650 [Candidatus Scalindua rubra]|uniref:Putative heme protein n=1 Tax=Candidatus Scalindua brodae TaxID=237368 RepID=A0A0B0EI04_9BACT|nr:MAG: putative heme protein [Candidatus Scalindua brodae]MBZ0108728.1 hypothetical protein [Candidatus Scalindua rubra]TWU31870.1 hypothetical protein S225a_19520 [Candidatus Brocadiaceae bacterium S225]